MKTIQLFVITLAYALALCAQTFDDFDMPAAVPLPDPKVQFLDANGRPLAGGLVYFYRAGTDTPQDTYTSSTGAVPNSNPVVLDSAGRASIWIKGESYKVVVKNSAGVTQWTADNVTDTTFFYLEHLRSISDSALLAYKPSIGGSVPGSAVERSVQSRLSERLSVKDFGAIGDGTTDDTDAIDDAIAAAAAGGTLFFPPGTYLTHGHSIAKALTVSCVGSDAVIKLGVAAGTVFRVASTSNVSLIGCTVDGGYDDGILDGFGVQVDNSSLVRIEGNRFQNIGYTGLDILNSSQMWIERNRFEAIHLSGVRSYDAVETNACSYIWIRDNYFDRVVLDGTNGHAAILFGTYGNVQATHHYIFVERNQINQPGHVGIGFNGVDSGFIADNRVVGNGTIGECIAVTGAYNTVSRNIVNGCGAAGILFYGVNYATNAHMRILDNITWDNHAQGIAFGWDQNDVTYSDVWISGNRAFDSGSSIQQYGLQFYDSGATGGSVSGVVVTNNDFQGNASGPWSYGSAYLSGVTMWLNRTSTGTPSLLADNGAVLYSGSDGMPTGNYQQMYVDRSTGRVSIGGTGFPPSPAHKLEVMGDVYVSSPLSVTDYPLKINATAVGSASTGIRLFSNTTEVARFGQTAGSAALKISNLNPTAHSTIEFFTEGEDSGKKRAYIDDRGFAPPTVSFSNLTAVALPYIVWCADCTVNSSAPFSCSGGGSGAWAFQNSGWKCPF